MTEPLHRPLHPLTPSAIAKFGSGAQSTISSARPSCRGIPWSTRRRPASRAWDARRDIRSVDVAHQGQTGRVHRGEDLENGVRIQRPVPEPARRRDDGLDGGPEEGAGRPVKDFQRLLVESRRCEFGGANPGPDPLLDELAERLGRGSDVPKALIVLLQEVVDGAEKPVDQLLELRVSCRRRRTGMRAGAGVEEPLAVGPAELVELVLEGADDVELGRAHLRQPLQALLFVTQRAARVEATPVLQVVPGAEMPAGPPGAEWLVSGIGGDEAGRLKRRAGVEAVGKWARVHTAVSVLVNQGHNRPF